MILKDGLVFEHDFATGQTSTVDPSPCVGAGRAKLDGAGVRAVLICGSSPTVSFKNVLTGAVVSSATANALNVAVSSDGEAFGWNDATAGVKRNRQTSQQRTQVSGLNNQCR